MASALFLANMFTKHFLLSTTTSFVLYEAIIDTVDGVAPTDEVEKSIICASVINRSKASAKNRLPIPTSSRDIIRRAFNNIAMSTEKCQKYNHKGIFHHGLSGLWSCLNWQVNDSTIPILACSPIRGTNVKNAAQEKVSTHKHS